jgi:hypothetical protein
MSGSPVARFARGPFVVLMLVLALPAPASAALGGTVASVDADRVHVKGALMRMVTSDGYALHEIRAATGTMVREYVNSSGTVFAVAWDGPWMPDLRQVLGDHFDQYMAAMRAPTARIARGVVSINQAGLVVQMSGHARAFTGRAYLPTMLPPGVRLETIR